MAVGIDHDLAGRQVLAEADAFLERLLHLLVIEGVARRIDQAAAIGERDAAPAVDQFRQMRAAAFAFGKLALGEGRITDAGLQFREALARLEAGTWSADQRRATRRIGLSGLATTAAARRDWNGAESHLLAALAVDPDDGTLRRRLAQALFHLGRRDEAATHLKQAARDDSTLEPAAVTMAMLYAGEGNVAKAGEWIEHAVKVGPNDPRAHLARAGWLLERGDYAAAADSAALAATLDPKGAEPRRIQAMAARLLGKYETAERILQAVLQESPGDFFASNQLALTLCEQADPAKQRRAVETAEINARQYPRSRDALSTLGWATFKVGRAEDARRILSAAVADGRSDSLTAYYLGRVLADLGRRDEARQLMAAAVEAPGPFSRREEARLWLDRLAPASPSSNQP
jgi:tetratricopeptide (TPR) repeat protein